MFYEPRHGHGLPWDPMKAIVAPRPIGWISTVDAAGRPNLAPYSYFAMVHNAPPMVAFGSEGLKHSAANARATGEFVANLATRALFEAMNASSADQAEGVSEFEAAGIAAAPSRLVRPPRVAASPAALECRVVAAMELPDAEGRPTGDRAVRGPAPDRRRRLSTPGPTPGRSPGPTPAVALRAAAPYPGANATPGTPMRLFISPASPFARKVLACAIARGLDHGIAQVPTNAQASPPELLAGNPLSKIPLLILDDGTPVFDSPVICDHLDTMGDAPPLMPPSGPDRLRAAVMQALADGIMDASVARRMQVALPQDEGRIAFDARQKAAVDRGLARLEAAPPEGLGDVGAIAVACALGYLDFRFAAEPWRAAHPRLAAWLASVEALPALARSAPS